MRYFVVGEDGRKFGPVEAEGLQQWIAEGRIQRHTTIEDETSGVRMAANAIPTLQFPERAEPTQPWLLLSTVLGLCSLTCVCFGPLSILMSGAGVFVGYLAFQSGRRWAVLSIALNLLGLGIWFWHPFPSASPEELKSLSKYLNLKNPDPKTPGVIPTEPER